MLSLGLRLDSILILLGISWATTPELYVLMLKVSERKGQGNWKRTRTSILISTYSDESYLCHPPGLLLYQPHTSPTILTPNTC